MAPWADAAGQGAGHDGGIENAIEAQRTYDPSLALITVLDASGGQVGGVARSLLCSRRRRRRAEVIQ